MDWRDRAACLHADPELFFPAATPAWRLNRSTPPSQSPVRAAR